MTAKYDSFQRFFFSLICRESEARETRDTVGNIRHYSVRVNSFEKLQRLALDVVNDTEHVEEVTELQRAAVAFVVKANRGIFVQFLNALNGRFMVANRFYPQCIEEYTYKRRDWLTVSEWVAELFTVAEETETAESSESVEETTETTETVEETAGSSHSSETPADWFTFSPLSRFLTLYRSHLREELTARRAGLHATIDAETFRELHAFALCVSQDRKTFHALTVKQQYYIAFITSIGTPKGFNLLHSKASIDALNRFNEEIFPIDEETDEETTETPADAVETSESVTTETETETTETETRPAPALYMRPSGLSIFVNFDEEPGEPAEEPTEPAGGVTPEDMERAYTRLLDALRARDGSHLLIIRPDDEPLSVNIDALLSLDSFPSRVAHIAEENGIDPGEVVRLLASAPLSYDDGDEDGDDGDGDEDEDDRDGDGDEDDGAPWGDDRDGDDGSGDDEDDEDDEEPGGGFYPLTWTEILTDPRLNGWGAHDEYLAHDDFLAHDEYLAHDGY